jgi:hypothetical protein
MMPVPFRPAAISPINRSGRSLSSRAPEGNWQFPIDELSDTESPPKVSFQREDRTTSRPGFPCGKRWTARGAPALTSSSLPATRSACRTHLVRPPPQNRRPNIPPSGYPESPAEGQATAAPSGGETGRPLIACVCWLERVQEAGKRRGEDERTLRPRSALRSE